MWNSNHRIFQKKKKTTVASPKPHENRRTLVLPVTHRKWRRAKNKTRTRAHTEAVTTAASCTTSPKQSPRLMYFIGALPPSELAKASCITPTNVLHKYVWRLPSSVDLLTTRFFVCARASCAPEYAPGSVEHHQTAQLIHKPSTPYPQCTAAAFSKVASCIQSGGNNPQIMPKEQTSPSPLKSLQFTHGTLPRGRACQERAHQGC